jgi:general secretion pathway protein I
LATRSQRGFTLIEVVVAFVLLALVFSVGLEVFTTGMRRAIDLEERSQALAVAQSRLAGAGIETALKEGTSAGQSDDGKYRWALTIARSEEGAGEPNQPAQSAYGLFRVEIVVAWRGADERDHNLSFATLQLGPIF